MLKRKTSLKRGTSQLKKSPLKKGGAIKARRKSIEELEESKYENRKMKDFFLFCWNTLPHYSEISKKWLGSEPKTIFYHHLKPKSTFEDIKYSVKNILVCTADEHATIENDADYFEVAKNKCKFVMDNYKTCIAESLEWSENYDKLWKKDI